MYIEKYRKKYLYDNDWQHNCPRKYQLTSVELDIKNYITSPDKVHRGKSSHVKVNTELVSDLYIYIYIYIF